MINPPVIRYSDYPKTGYRWAASLSPSLSKFREEEMNRSLVSTLSAINVILVFAIMAIFAFGGTVLWAIAEG